MRRFLVLGSICFVAAAAAAVVAVKSKPDYPVGVKIFSVESKPGADTKTVTVEFQRLKPIVCFFEPLQLQTRLGRRWQEPSKVALEDGFLARTNSQRIELLVPARAEACRFLTEYRVGRNPYCRAYFFLENYGLRKRFPKTCKFALGCIPKKFGIREVELELALPEQTDAAAQENRQGRGAATSSVTLSGS